MKPVHVDLAFKSRTVEVEEETEDTHDHAYLEPVKVRQTAFDKFHKVQNDDKATDRPHDYTFFKDITKKGGYPVFSNGKTRPVWPPTEEYAYSMLLLHKPGVHEFADVKGQHETYLEAFQEFLSCGRPHVPDCLARDLTRAYINHLFGNQTKALPGISF